MKSPFRHLIALWALGASVGAAAQIAVSVNAPPGTVALIDMKTMPPRLLDEIAWPGGAAASAVAVAPDEAIALVSGAQLSVIDLLPRPPRVGATLATGPAPAGVAINRAGTLALVANRGDCTVSVFAIAGKALTPAGTLSLGGAPDCGASRVAISPDGRSALVTRVQDQKVSVLSIDGQTVRHSGSDLSPGLRPGSIDFCVPGAIAVVANTGAGPGAADSLAVIDMTQQPPRIVQTLPVGRTPAALKCSPDGSYAAVLVLDGSDPPRDAAADGPQGRLVLYMVVGKSLQKFGELAVGPWPSAMAFAPDGLSVLVQSKAQRDIRVLRIDGMRLVDTGQRIALKGSGVALHTADKPR